MNREQLLKYITGLPEVEQRETWGHPTFRVRGKIFASLPDEVGTAIIKASLSEQQALVEENPDNFAPAPRVGRHGWIQVRFHHVTDEQMRELAHEAWQRTAPKRLVANPTAKSQCHRSQFSQTE